MRLWLACIIGPTLVAGLLWWLVATRDSGLLDPAVVWVWLPAVGGLGVALALAAALWIDRHVVGHLAGLVRSASGERVTDLRGLPSSSGWGELSELTQQMQMLLTRHRTALRSAAELEELLLQLGRVRDRLERWNRTERWEPMEPQGALLGPVVGIVNRGMAREQGVRDENLAAAGQVRGDLADALGEARESAEQAERGFVEATALLTTVRELQRLGGELNATLERLPAAPAPSFSPEPADAVRSAAADAIGELVQASTESVQHLAQGMRRVQEVSELVQRLANRATLIALQVVAAEPGPEQQAEQLKRLARDVREATERTTALAGEIDTEVAAANERMARARGEVAARLERLPEPAAPPPPPAVPLPEEVTRLLERVREMITDATRKGERLSAAGERSSRAAQRLARRLDEELRELDGLLVRLAPPAAPEAPSPSPGAPPARTPSAQGTLRLLGRETPPGAPPPQAQGEERP